MFLTSLCLSFSGGTRKVGVSWLWGVNDGGRDLWYLQPNSTPSAAGHPLWAALWYVHVHKHTFTQQKKNRTQTLTTEPGWCGLENLNDGLTSIFRFVLWTGGSVYFGAQPTCASLCLAAMVYAHGSGSSTGFMKFLWRICSCFGCPKYNPKYSSALFILISCSSFYFLKCNHLNSKLLISGSCRECLLLRYLSTLTWCEDGAGSCCCPLVFLTQKPRAWRWR